jgi:hypothetical protein
VDSQGFLNSGPRVSSKRGVLSRHLIDHNLVTIVLTLIVGQAAHSGFSPYPVIRGFTRARKNKPTGMGLGHEYPSVESSFATPIRAAW